MTDVKISKSEYEKMQRELSKLYALEAGGVDNWEWFDESLKDWRKENELSELLDDTMESFRELLADADVDEPAGARYGYNVTVDEDELKKVLVKFLADAKEIQEGDE